VGEVEHDFHGLSRFRHFRRHRPAAESCGYRAISRSLSERNQRSANVSRVDAGRYWDGGWLLHDSPMTAVEGRVNRR